MTYSPHEAPRLFATFRFRNATAMLEWLTQTIGFEVLARYDNDDGTVAHAELALGSSIIMCGEVRDDAFGALVGAPGEQGGKALYIAVEDVDTLFDRVSASGVKIEEQLTDRSYGSREFICRDPEGNVWCFGTYWPKAADAQN